jgi:NAD(P)-dependent dehydrogenase (short-subunit alcohol dehydrogenase family)
MIEMAVHEFGGLDVLVNNAGVLCDRTLVNMEPEELDAVTRVHVRGTFAPAHHAAAYWRNGSNAGRRRAQRLINTSSSSGLHCNPGQTNDGAAKAGIAAMTVIASRELDRYWVTINAIYPTAKSRLTRRHLRGQWCEVQRRRRPRLRPPGSSQRRTAGRLPRERPVWRRQPGVRRTRRPHHRGRGWHAGPRIDKGGGWSVAELGEQVPGLVAKAAGNALTSGKIPVPGA